MYNVLGVSICARPPDISRFCECTLFRLVHSRESWAPETVHRRAQCSTYQDNRLFISCTRNFVYAYYSGQSKYCCNCCMLACLGRAHKITNLETNDSCIKKNNTSNRNTKLANSDQRIWSKKRQRGWFHYTFTYRHSCSHQRVVVQHGTGEGEGRSGPPHS